MQDRPDGQEDRQPERAHDGRVASAARRRVLLGAGATVALVACQPAPPQPKLTKGPARSARPALPPGATTTTTVPGQGIGSGVPSTTAPPTTLPPTTVPTTTTTTAPPPTTTPPPPPTTTTTTTTTTTLPPAPTPSTATILAKCTYGRSAGAEAELTAMGWPAWLDAQLDPATIDDSAMDARVAGMATLTATNQQNILFNPAPIHELRHASLLRAVYSRRQLFEVMSMFFWDHLAVGDAELTGWGQPRYLRTVVRPHALGRFRDMVLASARCPAMLVYLDNRLSDARFGINENYGRELLELHTLGIHDGVVPYTEADVRGVATVLAGRRIQTGAEYLFDAVRASRAAVSILGGGWSRPDRTGAPAAQLEADGDSLITYLASHPMTARHLALKLCRRFVSDDPPSALVESAAAVYLANDTAIAPMVRHILTSPEFATSNGTKLRRPFELFAAMARAADADIGSGMGTGAFQISSRLNELGHALLSWPTPDGYPDVASRWISSSGALGRWNLAANLVSNTMQANPPATNQQVRVDRAALVAQGSTCGALVDSLGPRLLGRSLTTAERSAALAAAGVAAEAPATSIRGDTNRVTTVLAVVLSVPSFQFR